MQVELLAITPEAEKLLEKAGRTCYLSFDRIAENTEKKFLSTIIKHGHTSVLEHAYVTFRITGVSRSFTHQLVRHRIGAFSQQSQRYVNEKNFTYTTPPKIEKNPAAKEVFDSFMNHSKDVYMKLQELGIPNEDARFVLPNSVNSEIVFSTNFRELRHIFKVRGVKQAQWEIREVCIEMLKILKEKVPDVFSYCVINEQDKTISIGNG